MLHCFQNQVFHTYIYIKRGIESNLELRSTLDAFKWNFSTVSAPYPANKWCLSVTPEIGARWRVSSVKACQLNYTLHPLLVYLVQSITIFNSMLLNVYFELVVFVVQQVTCVGHNPVYERIKIGRVTLVLFICMHVEGFHNYANLLYIQLMVIYSLWQRYGWTIFLYCSRQEYLDSIKSFIVLSIIYCNKDWQTLFLIRAVAISIQQIRDYFW